VSRIRPSGELAVERFDDVVYIARLPGGPIYVLDGAAAAIWDASLQDDAESVVSRVASLFGRPAAEVGAGTEAFVAELVEAGLLVLEG